MTFSYQLHEEPLYSPPSWLHRAIVPPTRNHHFLSFTSFLTLLFSYLVTVTLPYARSIFHCGFYSYPLTIWCWIFLISLFFTCVSFFWIIFGQVHYPFYMKLYVVYSGVVWFLVYLRYYPLIRYMVCGHNPPIGWLFTLWVVHFCWTEFLELCHLIKISFGFWYGEMPLRKLLLWPMSRGFLLYVFF